MFNWLIKLLGGKTKSEYEDMQKELNENVPNYQVH